MIGLGVAGLGGLGAALVAAAASLPEPQVRVVAVQDVRAERAQAMAAASTATWCGERFDDLLRVEGVDAIAICTPNALHPGQAQAALRAGKDVLVQKPLALSRAAAEATVGLAADLQRVLLVDYSYRFLDTVEALRAALPRIGPPRAARGTFHNIYGPGADKSWFFDPALSGGGALIDLGVHLLDLGVWLLDPAAASDARLHAVSLSQPEASPTLGPASVERAAQVRVDLGGLPFDVEVSWNAPLPATQISFEVQGDAGVVRWENVAGSFFRFRTLLNGQPLVERETGLREDTLRAFATAVSARQGPSVDTRVYGLLEHAYARGTRAPLAQESPDDGVPS